MPNLLESLGHGSIATSPTPPLTPTSATAEELFFRVPSTNSIALGSPSDPSIRRMPTIPAARPKATPFLAPGDNGTPGFLAGRGYFDIPVTEKLPPATRPSRRRSSTASGASIFSQQEQEDWTIEKTDFGNGGLKNAVEASQDPSEKVYVGTLGFGTDTLDEATKVAIEGRLREDHNCLVAYTSNANFDGHYNHYCKEVCLSVTRTTFSNANIFQVLWPVFHYLIPDHPKSK
jgi:hypothetical protein